jgi:cell wall-associated NlpC family hydrolase
VTITRREVLRRAATIWPLGDVPYSQTTVRDPGWRTDCSGYVSMCLNLAQPGLSTVTLVTEGLIREITRDELCPGDLVGRCGPGTAGDAGHVVLFERWDEAHATYWAYEFHGGPENGPQHSLIHYPYHGQDGYQAYRYTKITDGPANA